MKRWMHRVMLASFVAVVLTASTGCARFRQGSVSGVREAVVERSTLLVVVSASGTIEPAERAVLSFDTSGRVTEVLVQTEDVVKAGDVLARLDSRQLSLNAKQARAQLASAEAQLAALKSGPRPEQVAAAEASLRAAQAQLDAAAAGRDKLVAGATDAEIASAEADLASAQDKQQSAEKMHDRTMKCFTFRLPPAGEERTICPALGTIEEQARLSLAAADQGLAAAQLRVNELLAGADADAVHGAQANVSAATAQRDSAQAQLDQLLAGAAKEQIASAEAGVEQAKAAVAQADLSLSDAQLVAPFDGIVAAINVTEGEEASVGLPVVTLVDTSSYHVSASVDEVDVGRLAVGQRVDVTVDAFPDDVLEGVVKQIAPGASTLGGVVYYDVDISLAPSSVHIRPDMSANVSIVAEQLDDVLTIPTWVVRVDPVTGQTYVERRAGGKVARVDVALGVRYQGHVQVVEGLSEGDVVVLGSDSNVSSAFPFGGK